MANFDELKQKAKDTMEIIADRSVELYKIAEEKTKIFAKITKLGAEIALEKGTVRKLYRDIGKKYYELHKESPEEVLSQTCEEVTATLESIIAKQNEIDVLKKSYDLGDKDDSTSGDKSVEVEIIIEENDNLMPDDAGSASDNLDINAVEADKTDSEDIISKTPPEFKL